MLNTNPKLHKHNHNNKHQTSTIIKLSLLPLLLHNNRKISLLRHKRHNQKDPNAQSKQTNKTLRRNPKRIHPKKSINHKHNLKNQNQKTNIQPMRIIPNLPIPKPSSLPPKKVKKLNIQTKPQNQKRDKNPATITNNQIQKPRVIPTLSQMRQNILKTKLHKLITRRKQNTKPHIPNSKHNKKPPTEMTHEIMVHFVPKTGEGELAVDFVCV